MQQVMAQRKSTGKKINTTTHATPAKNVDREELELQRQNILTEIKQTQDQLKLLQKDKNATYAQLQALQNKLNAREALIKNINKEINYIESNIKNAHNDVDNLTLSLKQLQLNYAELMRYSYKQRTSQDMLMFIFSSSSFYDALRRYNYIKQYRNYRKQQADKILATSSNLKNKIITLNQQKQQKDVMLKAEQEQKQVLNAETNQKNLVMQDLKGKEKELLQQVAEKKRISENLNRVIAAAIKREIELARKKAEEERRKQAAAKAEAERKAKAEAIARKKAAEEEKQRQLKEEREERERNQRITAIEKKKNNNLFKRNTDNNTGNLSKRSQGNNTIPIIEDKNKNTSANNNTGNKRTSNPRYLGGNDEPDDKPEPRNAETANNTDNKPSTYADDMSEENKIISSNFEANRGNLNSPVAGGYICEKFGKNKHPLYNVYTENFGVDIRTTKGATVRSVFAGEVSSVFYIAGAGNNILVNHGTYFTLYSKIDKPLVKAGSKISARQALGTVITDGDGNSQVHFEIWKVGTGGAQKINPEPWIRL
jgi:murein hydrolase activator